MPSICWFHPSGCAEVAFETSGILMDLYMLSLHVVNVFPRSSELNASLGGLNIRLIRALLCLHVILQNKGLEGLLFRKKPITYVTHQIPHAVALWKGQRYVTHQIPHAVALWEGHRSNQLRTCPRNHPQRGNESVMQCDAFKLHQNCQSI